MGKTKRLRNAKGDKVVTPATSLSEEILRGKTSEFARSSLRKRQGGGLADDASDDDDGAMFVDNDLTAKILSEARKQQQELLDLEAANCSMQSNHVLRKKLQRSSATAQFIEASKDAAARDDDEEEGSDDRIGDEYEPQELNAEEEAVFATFMNQADASRQAIKERIEERLSEKRTEIMSAVGCDVQQLDPRLVDMYQSVGVVLSTYRSGKLPKAFKIIPKLRNWEQILHLTNPNGWTAAAMYQATRIFSSNLTAKLFQRFNKLVLLPRIRDDIAEYKRLNPHLYEALAKAMFKPAAFFKGVLLPLCEEGNCTLREATIIASVVTKRHVPVLHAAAAMLKLAEMEYSGANSIFLRALVDKKYALPFRVIDALVFHFLRFESDKRKMPVLWHQALLAFCQRYTADISSDQKDALLALLRVHSHAEISPEIRRELTHRAAVAEDDEVRTLNGTRSSSSKVSFAEVMMETNNPDHFSD